MQTWQMRRFDPMLSDEANRKVAKAKAKGKIVIVAFDPPAANVREANPRPNDVWFFVPLWQGQFGR